MEYDMEEIAKHNVITSCWVVIHGGVYDVTKYLTEHPGGLALLLKASGRDATSDFEGMFHSPRARETLKKYAIGKVRGFKTPKVNELVPPVRKVAVQPGAANNGNSNPYGIYLKETLSKSLFKECKILKSDLESVSLR